MVIFHSYVKLPEGTPKSWVPAISYGFSVSCEVDDVLLILAGPSSKKKGTLAGTPRYGETQDGFLHLFLQDLPEIVLAAPGFGFLRSKTAGCLASCLVAG